MEGIVLLISLIAGLAIGGLIGYYLKKVISLRAVDSAERKADDLLSDAKSKQKEILLEAKDKAIKVIDEAKHEEAKRRSEIQHLQSRVEQREAAFDKKLLELENKQQELGEKVVKVEKIKEEVNKIKDAQLEKLEKIAQLTTEEAKKTLLDDVEHKIKDELVERVKKLQTVSSEELEARARDLLLTVIQRCAASHAAETTTTIVNLPSDEMKGRVIGREGRNIKAIEQLTGVEIVVDDTPEAILVTGFSPIRRHLAKRALDKLIADGRIHPGRIEEAVEEAKRELALDIKGAGEDAAREVGIAGLDPKLIQILGRLKYRTSYGQNQLKHALEVAHLSGLLAEELGANVTVAKKGGLLHDIGKAVDHEVQGGHPEIGYDILKKFGLPEEVAYICLGHHEDDPKSLEAIIVKVADAISGSRVGARKDTYEDYLQRLDELEGVATSFAGVEKAYAIQAGREVRVFVVPEEMDDWQSVKLARDIADKIEQDLRYPGEIKVNVIREKRITEYAR
ncbi:ribonuclease Y [Patescibacteria group bacterium]|nr:ribonuclease Y [Patescibacteria group bacterium]